MYYDLYFKAVKYFAGNLMAVTLIEAMLRRDPFLRPISATLAVHPFFWNKEHQLRFFMVSTPRIFGQPSFVKFVVYRCSI